jgi:hypothetical protein
LGGDNRQFHHAQIKSIFHQAEQYLEIVVGELLVMQA